LISFHVASCSHSVNI